MDKLIKKIAAKYDSKSKHFKPEELKIVNDEMMGLDHWKKNAPDLVKSLKKNPITGPEADAHVNSLARHMVGGTLLGAGLGGFGAGVAWKPANYY